MRGLPRGALANGTRFPHRTAFAVVVADFVARGSYVRETGWNLFEETRPGVGEVAAEHVWEMPLGFEHPNATWARIRLCGRVARVQDKTSNDGAG